METTTETTTTWHVSFSTSIYIVGDNYILLVLIIKIIIIIRIMMIINNYSLKSRGIVNTYRATKWRGKYS